MNAPSATMSSRVLYAWIVVFAAPLLCRAADWQYYVPVESAQPARGSEPNRALIWLPPKASSIRGALVGGQLGIELEIALDPAVRKVCAENDLAIVYFQPHLSGVFHYWETGNHDGERFLKALDDLAARTNHPELRRVPWITMGHSTAGIFCRNVAYWKPNRVAAVLHIKSGNLFQPEHRPPGDATLAGIPFLAINGQFETFGPASGIDPKLGRQTQWMAIRADIQKLRQRDPNHLISTWLDLGGDHFFGSPELSQYAALFIAETAKYRLPAQLPGGNGEVPCKTIRVVDGWLTDPDLYDPTHPPAAWADYTGDKTIAMWHYDRELAEANAAHHQHLGNHQAISNPVLTWLDDGDGWSFRATAQFLDTMPTQYGGELAGQSVTHADTPIVFRSRITEPVRQLSPDTFRLIRPVKSVNIAAVNASDESHRATNRWGSLKPLGINGPANGIEFPAIADALANVPEIKLDAHASSGLNIYYEVEYGPVAIRDNRAVISDLPANAAYPIECKITAWQIGRRISPHVPPAAPVSRTFNLLKP